MFRVLGFSRDLSVTSPTDSILLFGTQLGLTVSCRDPFPQTPRTDCVVHGYLSSAVQKNDKIPQMQFLDKLMTSVVVQRLVPGRVSADNCGGSAVAWGPCGDSTGAVLGQV